MKLTRRSTSDLVTVDTRTPVIIGDDASVYPVGGANELYAKIWRSDANEYVRRLVAMIDRPPADPTRNLGHVSIAWPIDILYTDNKRDCAGYLMPRWGVSQPLGDVLNPMTRRREMPLFSYRHLYRTARNLAATVSAIHSAGYVIGGLSDTNVCVTDSALVTITDTEHFHSRVGAADTGPRPPAGRPEYLAPERQNPAVDTAEQLPEQDDFVLAILIFQLLMEGNHPFAGAYTGKGESLTYSGRIQGGYFAYGSIAGPYKPRDSSPPFDLLPQALRDLFVRCFEEGHAAPKARPPAEEWAAALLDAEAAMKGCAVNSQHVYPNHLLDCPWCARARAAGGRDPFPSREEVEFERSGRRDPSQAPLPAPTVRPPSSRSLPPRTPQMAGAAAAVAPAAAYAEPARPAAAPAVRPIAGSSSGPAWSAFAVVIVVALVCGWLYAAHSRGSSASDAALTTANVLVTRAENELASASPVGADPSTAAAAYAAAAADCEQATGALAGLPTAAHAMPGYRSSRAILHVTVKRMKALELTLTARNELDDVTADIKANMNRALTAAQANAIKTRLVGRCNHARADCANALALDPKCDWAWMERIRAYRLMGDTQAANEDAETARSMFPADASDFQIK